MSLRLPEQSAPCRPGGLNNRNVFSYRSGDWQSKIKTMAELFFPEASLLGLYLAVFSLCPQGSSHCVCLCRDLLCKMFFKMHYLFLAVLSLYCFTGFPLVVGSRGYSLAVVCGLLIAMPSLILELSSALGCVGFSRYSAWAQYLWLLGSRAQTSIVVTHGVSYAIACGIFPDQGSNPCPLHWRIDPLPLSYQGNPANLLFKKI